MYIHAIDYCTKHLAVAYIRTSTLTKGGPAMVQAYGSSSERRFRMLISKEHQYTALLRLDAIIYFIPYRSDHGPKYGLDLVIL